MVHAFSLDTDPGTKRFQDGTHRLVSPKETLTKVSPLLAAMGITRVANVTGLDRIGVPVIMVTRPNARSIAVSQGKGLDLDAAKASGVMEAIEIYHAEHIHHPLKLACHNEMRSSHDTMRSSHDHDLVDLDRLAKLDGSRYHPDLPMLWIEGFDLLNCRPLWLPYETVHTNFTLPSPPGAGSFSPSTNGLASGNHILEATVHAICEIIERDALTLWRSNVDIVDLTSLDLDTVVDPACDEVLRRIDAAELEVAAFDVTSDLGVPVFFATLIDGRHDVSHPGIGSGCHLAPEVALLRALTEAVQVRMTYITGARDDLSPGEFTEAGRAKKLEPVRATMTHAGLRKPFLKVTQPPVGGSFADDLAFLLDRLKAVGIEQVVACDLTKPEFNVPVVKVVIPGLEDADDHAGYVPGPRALAAGGES